MTAALVAAVLVWVAVTLPPRRRVLAEPSDGTIAGLLHIHTNRSDGLGTPDVVAAAAARAGLRFVVFTDHGDATRTPDPPTYRSGVLCLDGVEISTAGGHYIAIDMPASPFPLGGEARDVVADVRRLGGFGIVAHPDSPKPQLRWTDWSVAFDAVELINPDTGWRVLAGQPGVGSKARLVAAFFGYPFRAPEVMASLIQPTAILGEWEAVARNRRLVTIAGADAHAKLAPRSADPDDARFALPLPGYEPSFRVMSVHVRLDRPLTGDAAFDALALTRGIRNGHLYTAIDGFASPPSFTFTATNALATVHAGDVISPGGAMTLRVQSNAPADYTTVVHEGTRTLAAVPGTQDLSVHAPDQPGVYWAEIVGPSLTWVRSNPIYVRGPATLEPTAVSAVTSSDTLIDPDDLAGWRIEHDANSVGAFEMATTSSMRELRYRFGLAGGAAVGQYTAIVRDLPDGFAGHDRISVTLRAERAMRVSVQLRDTTADRWQRSLYVDAAADYTIKLADFKPVGTTHVALPDPAMIRGLMFVVDTTNTKPGTAGRIWFRKVALEK